MTGSNIASALFLFYPPHLDSKTAIRPRSRRRGCPCAIFVLGPKIISLCLTHRGAEPVGRSRTGFSATRPELEIALPIHLPQARSTELTSRQRRTNNGRYTYPCGNGAPRKQILATVEPRCRRSTKSSQDKNGSTHSTCCAIS